MIQARRIIRHTLNVFWAALNLTALFWLYRTKEDPIGEMVVDQDLIDDMPDWDDDPGEDVDG